MQPEILNQLQCLDVQPSGDLIFVGGFDHYEIYVFSLQPDHLVEVISGHQAPITSIKFIQAEEKVLFVSGFWQKTIRIHDLYARRMKEGSGGDSMLHNSEVTALAAKKDNKLLDVQGNRIATETLAAQRNYNLKYFVAIKFSKDGQYLIGGENNKFICLYDMKYRILIRRFIFSNNLSLDGMKLKMNFKTIDQENRNIEESDEEKQKDNLPGAKTFDVSKRSSKRIPVQVFNLQFTESNKEFIVSSSEGVQILGPSKGDNILILQISMKQYLQKKQKKQINLQNFTEAFKLGLILNEAIILDQMSNSIPLDSFISIAKICLFGKIFFYYSLTIHLLTFLALAINKKLRISTFQNQKSFFFKSSNLYGQQVKNSKIQIFLFEKPVRPESLIVQLLEAIIKSLQINRSAESCLIWIKQILIDYSPLINGSIANKKIQNILQEVLNQIRVDFNRIKNSIRK